MEYNIRVKFKQQKLTGKYELMELLKKIEEMVKKNVK